jgi:hypothetical protein
LLSFTKQGFEKMTVAEHLSIILSRADWTRYNSQTKMKSLGSFSQIHIGIGGHLTSFIKDGEQ